MNQPKFLLHLNVDESQDNFSCEAPTLAVAHFASSFSFSTISGVLNDLPRERGIKRSRYPPSFLVKFAVSGVFTFGALFSYNTTNNSIHTLAFSSTLFVFVIIHIFHYCICYYL